MESKIGKPIAEKASLEGAAALYVSRESLRTLLTAIEINGLTQRGRLCVVERIAGDEFEGELPRRQAALCLVPEALRKQLGPKGVITTRAFLQASGLKEGDRVRISLTADEALAPEAGEVLVEDHVTDEHYSSPPLPEDVPHWEWALLQCLRRADHVFPGMVIEVNLNGFLKRPFKITRINGRDGNLCQATKATKVHISQPDDAQTSAPKKTGTLAAELPGLPKETEALKCFFKQFTAQPILPPHPPDPCALVLEGGPGTGKTFILDRIANCGWGAVHRIDVGTKLSDINDIFRLAVAQQPSLVLIDRLDVVVGKDRPNFKHVIEALGGQLDALYELATKIDTLPRVVVVATCRDYLFGIPSELQAFPRFHRNLILPIPAAAGRLEILKFHSPRHMAPGAEDALLALMAERTHAYSGRDLQKLVHETMWHARQRAWREREREGATAAGPTAAASETATAKAFVTRGDVERALAHVRPTAMRDINLKPPTVHWRDIGGNEALKKALRRMITYTVDFDRYGDILASRPKGLLLYGPPGCSKTLSAQAMATESGFNFFAVKGPELLNKYVGESERAVRQLFARARQASPSIIFFDEIDSMGGQRSGTTSDAGGSGGSSSGAVNMLTALLTEMDGFEALEGVLVLAATNRPDALDPALLRPGRFNHKVFVGLPGPDEREAILRIHLSGPRAGELDYVRLAELAEGCSGAEIKGACDEARELFMDGLLERMTGLEIEEEKKALLDGARMEMADLEGVLRTAQRGVTRDQLERYRRWAEQFTRS